VHPTDAILPNGRIAAPAGTSVFVGTGTFGMALSPEGRFAILSNAGSAFAGSASALAQAGLVAGPSLTVVDVLTMRPASVYRDPSAAFFMGVASARDPKDPSRTIVLASDAATSAVRVFDLDAGGTLTPETSIALPAAHALPAEIAVSADGRDAYVADNVGNAVVEIDLSTRSVVRPIPVGDAPLYVDAGRGVLVSSSSGLSTYRPLSTPQPQPEFTAPAFDPAKSSTLSVMDLSAVNAIADPATVAMDPAPDGTQIVGGAAPGAITLSKDGRLAYVALSNVDRIAVVSLSGAPRVVRGLDLRL
jgi:YVTN family beta-propeller protein